MREDYVGIARKRKRMSQGWLSTRIMVCGYMMGKNEWDKGKKNEKMINININFMCLFYYNNITLYLYYPSYYLLFKFFLCFPIKHPPSHTLPLTIYILNAMCTSLFAATSHSHLSITHQPQPPIPVQKVYMDKK